MERDAARRLSSHFREALTDEHWPWQAERDNRSEQAIQEVVFTTARDILPTVDKQIVLDTHIGPCAYLLEADAVFQLWCSSVVGESETPRHAVADVRRYALVPDDARVLVANKFRTERGLRTYERRFTFHLGASGPPVEITYEDYGEESSESVEGAFVRALAQRLGWTLP